MLIWKPLKLEEKTHFFIIKYAPCTFLYIVDLLMCTCIYVGCIYIFDSIWLLPAYREPMLPVVL